MTKPPTAPRYAPRVAIVLLLTLALRTDGANWPGPDWPVATPEGQGMSSARLDALKDRLAAKKT